MDTSPNTPASKTQRIMWKMELKDCKSKRIREFAVGLFLLVIPEAIPITSHKHELPKQELSKDDTNGHVKLDGESLNPAQRTTGN